MKRIGFRRRLFGILMLAALVPAAVLTLVWGRTASEALSYLSGSTAWERVATSGERAIAAAREAALTPAQAAAVTAHEQELAESVTQARRLRVLASRAVTVVLASAVVGMGLLALVTWRVAGHLSRQLSRPLDEIVGWTERLSRGEPLPLGPPRRGAPEFEVLREHMRSMALALEDGRMRAMEAERLRGFRESARQVAHEIKNPLTPIRFAVSRLKREAPPSLADVVDVLSTESDRLERIARSFAQFGRLPEGPAADVDLAELARYTATATVPPSIPLRLEVEEGLPMVRGHHDALAGALSNVLLNAVDACGTRAAGGAIDVRVARGQSNGGGHETVEIAVRDSGVGVPAEQLDRIWEPYVTNKPGGTGLGLAVARQAILAHSGSMLATSEPGAGTEIRFTLPVDGTNGSGG